jgi:hypothetical protein
LTIAASELSTRGFSARLIAACAVASVMAASMAGVRAHLLPWEHAATLRDGVLRAAADDARLQACPVVYVQDLPDSVDGAYLFANGAREALGEVGINAFVRNERDACAFRWDHARRGFVRWSP